MCRKNVENDFSFSFPQNLALKFCLWQSFAVAWVFYLVSALPLKHQHPILGCYVWEPPNSWYLHQYDILIIVYSHHVAIPYSIARKILSLVHKVLFLIFT